jgi:hypothetical protein
MSFDGPAAATAAIPQTAEMVPDRADRVHHRATEIREPVAIDLEPRGQGRRAVQVAERNEARQAAEYIETGGLQWGSTSWVYNMSWPFARIEIWRERVYLTAKLWKIVDVKFDLEKSDVQAVRKRRGLFSIGVVFEHKKDGYPSLLLFWTSNPDTLIEELQRLDYCVLDGRE